MHLFEPRQVMDPIFVPTRLVIWKSKAMNYVAVVIGEALPQKAFYVLKQECDWTDLTDSADSLREHVPRIVASTMLSAERERLAWGTATN